MGQLPPTNQEPRGVSNSKKEDIVKKLTPLMPLNRRDFWTSLFVNDSSNDFVDSF